MTQGIDERQRLEMALSFKMDPETAEPLTEQRKAEIEARLAELDGDSDAERARGNSFTADQAHGVAEHLTEEGDGTAGAPGEMPLGGQPDIQALVQAEVAKAIGGQPWGGMAQAAPQPQQVTFEDILKQIDPRDSDAALAMLAWLEANGRIQAIGTINGGGYIYHYSEPKGSSKAGYTPGKTKGGRMVDQALDQAKATGDPQHTGICGTCMSAVVQQDDGLGGVTVTLADEPNVPNYTAHDDGTPHTFVG